MRLRVVVVLVVAMAARVRSLTVTLVRHGETTWNVLGKLQGSSDSPLTKLGIDQAVRCGRRLKAKQFVAAYCSPLPRARRTAELILENMDTPPPLLEDSALRERSFGAWEGLVWKDIETMFPEEIAASRADADYAIPGGGESRNENLLRVQMFLNDLLARHAPSDNDESCVLCVTHSATAVALIKEVLGLPQASRRSFDVRNLAINQLQHDGAGWRVVTLGDVAHLEILD
jgi:broad specificity phosphatase PhoE